MQQIYNKNKIYPAVKPEICAIKLTSGKKEKIKPITVNIPKSFLIILFLSMFIVIFKKVFFPYVEINKIKLLMANNIPENPMTRLSLFLKIIISKNHIIMV